MSVCSIKHEATTKLCNLACIISPKTVEAMQFRVYKWWGLKCILPVLSKFQARDGRQTVCSYALCALPRFVSRSRCQLVTRLEALAIYIYRMLTVCRTRCGGTYVCTTYIIQLGGCLGKSKRPSGWLCSAVKPCETPTLPIANNTPGATKTSCRQGRVTATIQVEVVSSQLNG